MTRVEVTLAGNDLYATDSSVVAIEPLTPR